MIQVKSRRGGLLVVSLLLQALVLLQPPKSQRFHSRPTFFLALAAAPTHSRPSLRRVLREEKISNGEEEEYEEEDEPLESVPSTPQTSVQTIEETPSSSPATSSAASRRLQLAGIEFDLQGYIDEQIALLGNSNIQIVIPPGQYRVTPTADNGFKHHLILTNLHNVTISAYGVEMICTKTTRAISIDSCTGLTMEGLTVDYDELPFTQGRIVEMSDDKVTMWIEIMEGYPGMETVTGDKLEIYNPSTDELRAHTYYGVSFEVDGPLLKATKPSKWSLKDFLEQLDDIAVIASKNTDQSIPHAIVPDKCENLVMKDVTLYSANMFGFFEKYCSASSYINCVVDRRPMESDLREREYRRLRSLTADAFHSKFASVGPRYKRCIAQHMGDDGIAINGHYHIILKTSGSHLRVIGKFGKPPNLLVGDMAELVSYSGERIADARIESFEQGTDVTQEERDFLMAQNFRGDVKKTQNALLTYNVELDREVNLPTGSLIASSNRVGNGFEVRNCTLGPNRSRGILVKASDGIIAGNSLVGNWGRAILMSPEYQWLEAGSGNNIIITDNIISGCHDVAIAVTAKGGDGSFAPAGAHNAVSITGNHISNSANPAIAITSTQGLELHCYTIEETNNDLVAPWKRNSFGRDENPDQTIFVENNEDVNWSNESCASSSAPTSTPSAQPIAGTASPTITPSAQPIAGTASPTTAPTQGPTSSPSEQPIAATASPIMATASPTMPPSVQPVASTATPTTTPPTPSPPTGQCGVQDHQGECTTTGQCRGMYATAYDCKSSEGGVCFCGNNEVCGCIGSAPTPTPPTPSSAPTPTPPTPSPPTPSPPTGQCGAQDHQGECTTTGQCKGMYATAYDCKNSEGGVCFCGDNQVCGCL